MNIESTIRDMSLSLVQAYARSHVVYDVIDRDLPLVDLNASGRLYVWSGADRKSTRLNSSHIQKSRMPSSA